MFFIKTINFINNRLHTPSLVSQDKSCQLAYRYSRLLISIRHLEEAVLPTYAPCLLSSSANRNIMQSTFAPPTTDGSQILEPVDEENPSVMMVAPRPGLSRHDAAHQQSPLSITAYSVASSPVV